MKNKKAQLIVGPKIINRQMHLYKYKFSVFLLFLKNDKGMILYSKYQLVISVFFEADTQKNPNCKKVKMTGPTYFKEIPH